MLDTEMKNMEKRFNNVLRRLQPKNVDVSSKSRRSSRKLLQVSIYLVMCCMRQSQSVLLCVSSILEIHFQSLASDHL